MRYITGKGGVSPAAVGFARGTLEAAVLAALGAVAVAFGAADLPDDWRWTIPLAPLVASTLAGFADNIDGSKRRANADDEPVDYQAVIREAAFGRRFEELLDRIAEQDERDARRLINPVGLPAPFSGGVFSSARSGGTTARVATDEPLPVPTGLRDDPGE